MSNAAIIPAPATDNHDPHGGHAHDPHLAHHFDTPEQQYASAKLGMWIFLGTEILMFGGLFCAYSVYRHNHSDVFAFAHHALDKWLGALNTLVLITSSLTMAWAVRSSQLGNQASLRWLMALTILGGYVFLGIKSVEYHKKWQHELFIGTHNKYRERAKLGAELPELEGNEKFSQHVEAAGRPHTPPVEAPKFAPLEGPKPGAPPVLPEGVKPVAPPPLSSFEATAKSGDVLLVPPDPNAGNSDKAQIRPTFATNQSMAAKEVESRVVEAEPPREKNERDRIYTFFGVYFFMTGLHGIHVLVGMALITWILLRALGPKNNAWAVPMIPGSIGVFLAVVGIIIGGSAGTKLIIWGLIIAVLCVLWAMVWVPRRRNRSGESEFGPTYFTPVDLIGLYWHLVDLIWIFLFPLLYLIH